MTPEWSTTGASGGLSTRSAFTGIMIGMALAAISQTLVSTALPTIVGDLGGYDQLSWVVSAYLLTSAVVVPLRRRARRPLRHEPALPTGDRGVRRRLGPRRRQHVDGPPDRRPQHPGVGRRGDHDPRLHARRTHRGAPGTRPLPGLHRLAVRGHQRARTARRRVLRRPPHVAPRVRHQRRAERGGARRVPASAAGRRHRPRRPPRPARLGVVGGGPGLDDARVDVGRSAPLLDVRRGHRPGAHRHRLVRAVHRL